MGMYVEIAGVPFEARCRFEEENRRFFRDYLTTKAPLFTIEPVESDWVKAQACYSLAARREGRPEIRYNDPSLENTAIHSLLAEKLVEHRVLLMHGSALCMDREAYIFTAPSGTGKSTHARLWREVFGERVWMINDDKPMLKFEDGGVMVYGTPWGGKHHLSRNASAPLKAIVELTRARDNRIEALPRQDAFQAMVRHAYASRIAQTAKAIAGLEARLVHSIPFYRLYCNMDRAAALTAWKGMNRGNSC